MQAYDGALQMWIEQPKLLDYDKLRFLRWLLETRPDVVDDGYILGPSSDHGETIHPSPAYSGRAA